MLPFLEMDGGEVDLVLGQVTIDGQHTALTNREHALLTRLVEAKGQTVPRQQFLDLFGLAPGSRAVDMCVASLRGKLPQGDLIETKRGKGYCYSGPPPVFRTGQPAEEDPVAGGALSIDWSGRRVHNGVEWVKLSPLEVGILRVLHDSAPNPVTTQNLMNKVWRRQVGDASVHNCVRRLRRKIEPDVEHPRWIRTVDGLGYAFEIHDADVERWVVAVHLPWFARTVAASPEDALARRESQRLGLTGLEWVPLGQDGWAVLFQGPEAVDWARERVDAAVGVSKGTVRRTSEGWWGRPVLEAQALAEATSVGVVLATEGVAEATSLSWRHGGVVNAEVGPLPVFGLSHGVRSAHRDSGFVGRGAEVAAVVEGLANPGWVTLRGPGGIGKTQLARAAAVGALFVDLSALHTRDEVVSYPNPASVGSRGHRHRDRGAPLASRKSDLRQLRTVGASNVGSFRCVAPDGGVGVGHQPGSSGC